MMIIIVIIILLVILYVIYYNYKLKCLTKENFGGALVQLITKGPQDTYLSDDALKYIPEFYYPYGEFIFNNPVRLYKYPYLYWYPYPHYLFPVELF